MADYGDNDPKGWGGDPSRGAALGRPSRKGDPEGVITVRESPLDRQGYDRNGTYFGAGSALYWYADESGNLDDVMRSQTIGGVVDQVRDRYPDSVIQAGLPLALPCWGAGDVPCPDDASADPEYGDQCEACAGADDD